MLQQEKNSTGRRAMRVTIIDHHTAFADSLGLVLEGEGFLVSELEPWRSDACLAGILAKGLRSAARLVLLDESLGRLGASTRLIAPLAASGAAVVVLAEDGDRRLWGEALQHGARAVLDKACTLDDVVTTAVRVRDGVPLMSPAERAELVAAARSEREERRVIRARLSRLTRREAEVLGALMAGSSVGEIARASVVSPATVRTQVKTILAKLETTSQLAAVGAAHRVGWLGPGGDGQLMISPRSSAASSASRSRHPWSASGVNRVQSSTSPTTRSGSRLR